jgi:CDP-paratose 2-epimerase
MSVAVVTGSAGLIGSEAVRMLASSGYLVVGFDNDLRSEFFGPEASTRPTLRRLAADLGASYVHHDVDVRDREAVGAVFRRYGEDITVIVHAAAQPGHAKWSMGDPIEEFEINATATLGLLEAARQWCPGVVFLFCSTSKVYGDRVNGLPMRELATRWEIETGHEYQNGVTETMSLDGSTHTSLGMSKLAADIMVQEYGLHHGLRTAAFRNCVIAGSAHAASKSHGMLGYIMQVAAQRRPYTVLGYGGKQVRDVLHVSDLVRAFTAVIADPHPGAVYNMGGGRYSHCSVLEAIRLAEGISGHEVTVSFEEQIRVGDHIWWIGSNELFQRHYPDWAPEYDVKAMLQEIYEVNDGWRTSA